VAGGTLVLLMAVSTRYGWHRDELYFVACGRKLAWGYVDQPSFTPLVARVSQALFGTSLAGLRLWPALALVVVVLLTALMARELGGGRFAQGLAALAAGICPLFLGEGHLLATATFDLLFWTAITYMVVTLLHTGDQRLWLVAGALAGIGLHNKHSVVFLLAGLFAGLALTQAGRRQLASPWPWVGVCLAAVIWLPNVLWHARHDWPVFDMLDSLREEGGAEARVLFIPSQLFVLATLAALWIPGLLWLLRDPAARAWRCLGVTYVALVALFVVTGGKPYYAAGIYPVLLAAGAGVWERGTHRRQALVWVAAAAIGMPLAIPVAPVSLAKHHPIEDLEKEFGSQLGWHDLVEQVADVAPQGRFTIFTGDYGAAGAIDLWGHEYGLPKPISGHNNYWIWGYDRAHDTGTTIAVGLGLGIPRGSLADAFDSCRLVGRVSQPHGVLSEEAGAPIYVCQGQRVPWSELWPTLQSYAA
jgi:hypothetical protein